MVAWSNGGAGRRPRDFKPGSVTRWPCKCAIRGREPFILCVSHICIVCLAGGGGGSRGSSAESVSPCHSYTPLLRDSLLTSQRAFLSGIMSENKVEKTVERSPKDLKKTAEVEPENGKGDAPNGNAENEENGEQEVEENADEVEDEESEDVGEDDEEEEDEEDEEGDEEECEGAAKKRVVEDEEDDVAKKKQKTDDE